MRVVRSLLRRPELVAGVLGAALFLVSCLVIRGGLLDSAPYGDVHLYREYGQNMAHGQWPYTFFDEYPPLAQPLFWFVTLLPGSYAAAFKWTMALLGAGSVALLVAALASVRASRTRIVVAAATAGVAPLFVGRIFLNAYDLWPTFLVAAALVAFVRRHERAAYVLLALGVAAKVYPVVLLPLALVEILGAGRPRASAALARLVRRRARARACPLCDRRPRWAALQLLDPAEAGARDREPRRLRSCSCSTGSASTT